MNANSSVKKEFHFNNNFFRVPEKQKAILCSSDKISAEIEVTQFIRMHLKTFYNYSVGDLFTIIKETRYCYIEPWT